MAQSERITELYTKAHQLMTQAKALLEAGDALTDPQEQQINAWLQEAETIEKRAKMLEAVLEKELELADEKAREDLELQAQLKKQKEAKAGFQTGWEFLKAVWEFRERGKYDPRLAEMEQKDMAGEVGAVGGFLIPQATQQQILTTRGEASIVRPRCRVVPMGTRVVPFPAVDYTLGGAGESSFYGGVRLAWTGENQPIDESEAHFREIELHARELAGYTEIPNGLIRDSAVSLEAFLSGPGSFGGALAWAEDRAYLRGDGAAKPLGVLNAPGRILVGRAAPGAFGFVDAVTMFSRMLMSGNPVWVMNQTVIPQLFQMQDGVGNLIWLPNASGTAPSSLLGFPIVWTEKTPVLGVQGDVALVDFSYYLIGDRQQVTIDVSREHQFRRNQTAFRIVEAVDGQPWINAPIPLPEGAVTVSPYVVLN